MWAKAEQERELQNNSQLQNSAPKPPVRNDGPVVDNSEEEKNK